MCRKNEREGNMQKVLVVVDMQNDFILFGAVLCHVDCAHGRAADEHDEEEEGDESGLFVLDNELLELIHIYILSAFRQRQSQG